MLLLLFRNNFQEIKYVYLSENKSRDFFLLLLSSAKIQVTKKKNNPKKSKTRSQNEIVKKVSGRIAGKFSIHWEFSFLVIFNFGSFTDGGDVRKLF